MSDCLWNDIESYLTTNLNTEMGSGSGVYGTVLLADIDAGESWDPDHVSYPFCFVRTIQAEAAGDYYHTGSEEVEAELAYDVEIHFAVIEDALADARSNIRELVRRCRTFFRARPALGQLQATDGEIVTRFDIGRAMIRLDGLGGTNQGKYMGLAVCLFTVFSETE